VADVELIIIEPHVSFNPHASSLQCRVQRDPAPVVVVGVAADGDDIARDISGAMLLICGAGTARAWQPVMRGAVIFVREEREDDAAGDGDKLNDAAVVG
jgi:hypothetical protein